MFPVESRSTSSAPASAPKYQIAATSSCAASTGASSACSPVTTLTTPPGRSEVSSTWQKSVAESGQRSEGRATTVLPAAMAGATSEMKPSSGSRSGHAMATTPRLSGMARVTLR